MVVVYSCTAQKMKFFIKHFFSKCDQIRRFLRIWSYLLKKSLMEKLHFCAVLDIREDDISSMLQNSDLHIEWFFVELKQEKRK